MSLGYKDTPLLPGGKYCVHDSDRPQPKVITPPSESTQAAPGTPPSDAIVLFDGKDLSKWESLKGGEAQWKVTDGYMEVVPKTGNIRTKEKFGSLHLHVEMAAPEVVKGDGQGRGNSGIFLNGQYEVQVLDNYENPTYPDGTCGGLYGQWPPLANACRKPGQWNYYDIIFEGPYFVNEKLVRPAFITVLFNGVVLHHAKELQGPTQHKTLAGYQPQPHEGPVMLQDHGDLVRFRNIWVRPLGEYDKP